MAKHLTEDQLFDEIAIASSEQFAKLLVWANNLAYKNRRRGAEDMLALILCDNLGTLIGMAAIDPQMMASSICARLMSHPFKENAEAARIRKFGHKLGVVQDIPDVVKPEADVADGINIGPPKE